MEGMTRKENIQEMGCQEVKTGHEKQVHAGGMVQRLQSPGGRGYSSKGPGGANREGNQGCFLNSDIWAEQVVDLVREGMEKEKMTV